LRKKRRKRKKRKRQKRKRKRRQQHPLSLFEHKFAYYSYHAHMQRE